MITDRKNTKIVWNFAVNREREFYGRQARDEIIKDQKKTCFLIDILDVRWINV